MSHANPIRLSLRRAVLALPLLCATALVLPGSGAISNPSSFAYHLRIVRFAGAEAPAGAGFGCSQACGTPVILPAGEAWGTTEQLAALAGLLRGERADPVTGFLVRPEPDGTCRFEGTIYPGETWARLAFTASAPDTPEGAHDIRLEVAGLDEERPALAEAHVLVRTDRTVAIASPSPLHGEWIVVAVTPLDSEAAVDRIRRGGVEDVVPIDGTMAPPQRVLKVDPVYPKAARDEKRTGKIVLQAVIDTEGIPRAIQVLGVPDGCEDMAAACVEAVGQWRYVPAKRNGKPVAVYFTIQVEFSLG
jgi:protein TonB